ncbi:uncharacterized protein LACBIDRAFT_323077 [Laccaria bicolor S238N-H82]|uniref:Predicted protein n=1 Tax=Laccaria bicolor (strain S238N-H82 / ATCC MYA-4686) TaxID=486041 RepID=B0CW17_LACBS|nr:uncharacterized protein LACBIDRAFT_323077 [Laccaria bicolor S238N-H82]EDR13432.1 predicted protein [Laccaria bicolor S238N-H82]|eukprot:XP_001875930.1 predicted protein [Laccaria bicolor S238N-H82]
MYNDMTTSILTMSFSDLSIFNKLLFTRPNVPSTPEIRSPTLPGHYPSSAFRPPTTPLSRPRMNALANDVYEPEGATARHLLESTITDKYARGGGDVNVQPLATTRHRQKSRAMEVSSSDEDETHWANATSQFQEGLDPEDLNTIGGAGQLAAAQNIQHALGEMIQRMIRIDLDTGTAISQSGFPHANLYFISTQPSTSTFPAASSLVPAAPIAPAAAPPSSSAPPVTVEIEVVTDQVRTIGNNNSHVHGFFRFEAPPTSALEDQKFTYGDVFEHSTPDQGGGFEASTTFMIWQYREDTWVNVTDGYNHGKIHHPSIPGYVLVPSTAREPKPTYILLKSFNDRKRSGYECICIPSFESTCQLSLDLQILDMGPFLGLRCGGDHEANAVRNELAAAAWEYQYVSLPIADPYFLQLQPWAFCSSSEFSSVRLRVWAWRFLESVAADVAANLKSGGLSLLHASHSLLKDSRAD